VRRYQYYQTDVFTEVLFAGNPVAVFPEANGLADAEMQQIAREIGHSVTAFVLSPTDARAHAWVRFFAPALELPIAAQAALGAHVVLAARRTYEIAGPVTRIWQQTRIGLLPVDLITDGAGRTNRAVMTLGEARHGDIYPEGESLASALGLHSADMHHSLPAQVYSTGLPGLIVPLATLDAVQRADPNLPLAREICRTMSVIGGGLYVFSLETLDNAHHAHARCFSPLSGVLEEAASGAMAGALGAYLLGKGVIAYEAEVSTTHMVIEQGYEMARPSLIEVEVDVRSGAVSEVRVSGQVVHTAEGTLFLE